MSVGVLLADARLLSWNYFDGLRQLFEPDVEVPFHPEHTGLVAVGLNG